MTSRPRSAGRAPPAIQLASAFVWLGAIARVALRSRRAAPADDRCPSKPITPRSAAGRSHSRQSDHGRSGAPGHIFRAIATAVLVKIVIADRGARASRWSGATAGSPALLRVLADRGRPHIVPPAPRRRAGISEASASTRYRPGWRRAGFDPSADAIVSGPDAYMDAHDVVEPDPRRRPGVAIGLRSPHGVGLGSTDGCRRAPV